MGLNTFGFKVAFSGSVIRPGLVYRGPNKPSTGPQQTIPAKSKRPAGSLASLEEAGSTWEFKTHFQPHDEAVLRAPAALWWAPPGHGRPMAPFVYFSNREFWETRARTPGFS